MDIRQYLLLAVATLVPLVLLLTGQRRALLAWVACTLFVQVFDTCLFTNLAAGRVVGLVYLPFALVTAGRWLRLWQAKAWLCNYAYLVLLAVLWGFCWQWPDITGQRPLSQLGPGRSVIYLLRLASDLSLTVFVAQELARPGGLETMKRAIIMGSTATSLAAMAAVVVQTDFYHAFTGLSSDLSLMGRARGLSYEPRGLGMACAHGVLVLNLRSQPTLGWISLLAVNLLGLVLSGSTSALAMFAAGLGAMALFGSNRQRLLLAAVAVGGLAIPASLAAVAPDQFDALAENILYRVDPTEKLMGAQAENLGQRIAYQMDAFDGSALLFLLNEPVYVLTGAGPGLVSLPASYYVPPGLYSSIWTDEVGINTLPTHGPLLEITNSGLPGLSFWLMQLAASWGALRLLTTQPVNRPMAESWKLGRGMFVLGVAFYTVQASVSPVWSVFCAIGWGASLLAGQLQPRLQPVRSSALECRAQRQGAEAPYYDRASTPRPQAAGGLP